MIISYLRSSSYNTEEGCQQQYFIEYVLGWRGKGNLAADTGSIVHKILEILANIKLANQNNEDVISDEILGKAYDIKTYSLDEIIDKVFGYYVELFDHHSWSVSDYNKVVSTTNAAITYHNGLFDPRNRTIVYPEKHFDIEINRPWAAYEYDFQGKKYSGLYAIKGTIDLITEIDAETYEIIDWKTGASNKDWATGKEKNHTNLKSDPQLRMYHYAVHAMYPHIKQCICTIFFINAGGPVSICFDNEDLKKTEEMLRLKFKKIELTKFPALNKSFKCSRFCSCGTNTFKDTTIKPQVEFRRGQLTKYGENMTRCEQVLFETQKKGIDWVTDNMSNPEISVQHYKAPGTKE